MARSRVTRREHRAWPEAASAGIRDVARLGIRDLVGVACGALGFFALMGAACGALGARAATRARSRRT